VVPRLGCDSIESVPFRSFTGIAIGDVKIPTPRPPATELSGVDFGPVPCPTRGGLASTLNEIASASNVGIDIDETALPVRPEVQSACELLGLDPVYVANEGKVVFFVAPETAGRVLEVLRSHSLGRDAARIGAATPGHKRMLVARTAMGANRVIPTMIGEQLPRIC